MAVDPTPEIRAAIDAARLPKRGRFDCDVLAHGIQAAIERYRATDVPSNEARRAIGKLWKLADKVARGEMGYAQQLSEEFKRMPAAAQRLLAERADRLSRRASLLSRRHSRVVHEARLPTPEQLADPATARTTADALRFLTQSGATPKRGRQRPGGKQSPPTAEPVLWAPGVSVGRTKNEAARELVMWLAVAWREATGSKPSLSAHRDKPGPFVRLVKAVLIVVGARHVDAVELVNRYGKQHKLPNK
jgi:hypothetical protein